MDFVLGATEPSPDWSILGWVSAIVGAFLIANATLLEHPRHLVSRYFGSTRGRLQSVREYVYNRVQTTLGFGFLLAGFGLQLVGHYTAQGTEPPLSMAWIGGIVVLAVALLFLGWWWSLWAFRRYVREYFTENPRNLDIEPQTVREIGELFGIESHGDDTVEDYVLRLRAKAGMAPPGGSLPVVEPDLEFEGGELDGSELGS